MNKNAILTALLCLCLAGTGCVQVYYQRREFTTKASATEPAREEAVVTMNAWSLFADERISKLSIDKVTKTTSSGLTVGSVDSEVSTEALNGFTESIVSGIVKGITSKP